MMSSIGLSFIFRSRTHHCAKFRSSISKAPDAEITLLPVFAFLFVSFSSSIFYVYYYYILTCREHGYSIKMRASINAIIFTSNSLICCLILHLSANIDKLSNRIFFIKNRSNFVDQKNKMYLKKNNLHSNFISR